MTQLFGEDVEVGSDVPSLVKRPTTRQLVKWAGAVGDWYEIHYDKDIALAQGLPGVIVHGWLTFSFMSQLVTDWVGKRGNVKKLSCSYRKMCVPGEDIVLKGKVTKKVEAGEKAVIECDIWAEKAGGEKAVEGRATVCLPLKAARA